MNNDSWEVKVIMRLTLTILDWGNKKPRYVTDDFILRPDSEVAGWIHAQNNTSVTKHDRIGIRKVEKTLAGSKRN